MANPIKNGIIWGLVSLGIVYYLTKDINTALIAGGVGGGITLVLNL